MVDIVLSIYDETKSNMRYIYESVLAYLTEMIVGKNPS